MQRMRRKVCRARSEQYQGCGEQVQEKGGVCCGGTGEHVQDGTGLATVVKTDEVAA